MNRYVFITLEWAIYIYIHRGSPYMDVVTMFLNGQTALQSAFRHYVVLAKKHWHKDEQVTVIFAHHIIRT